MRILGLVLIVVGLAGCKHPDNPPPPVPDEFAIARQMTMAECGYTPTDDQIRDAYLHRPQVTMTVVDLRIFVAHYICTHH